MDNYLHEAMPTKGFQANQSEVFSQLHALETSLLCLSDKIAGLHPILRPIPPPPPGQTEMPKPIANDSPVVDFLKMLIHKVEDLSYTLDRSQL